MLDLGFGDFLLAGLLQQELENEGGFGHVHHLVSLDKLLVPLVGLLDDGSLVHELVGFIVLFGQFLRVLDGVGV